MSKQRRTADDFVRDMKAKQQHNTPGEIERKASEGLPHEQAGASRGNHGERLTSVAATRPSQHGRLHRFAASGRLGRCRQRTG
jgi:hypothetical protein